MSLIYYIYPRIMTEVSVSATVGMSATVGEMSATVGKLNNYGLGNLRVQIVIYNSPYINSENTWNNM